MKMKGSFKKGLNSKSIIPFKEVAKKVAINNNVKIKLSKTLVTYLEKTKKEPPILFLTEKLSKFKKNPEIRMALINSFTNIITKRKKEWPDLYNDWQLYLDLEKIMLKKRNNV
jgi:hypothetical protein